MDDPRTQHEKELCGDLVPRLFDDDVWKDIEPLDVEDTILVLRQAQDVLRKGLFDDLYNDTTWRKDVFESATARLGHVLGQKVMALPVLYTLVDNATQLPAMDRRGGIFLFSKKEYADKALDYHLQQMRIWKVREIVHKDIYPFLGNEFYDNGARYAVINDGQDWSINQPEDFMEKPSGYEDKDTISNPDYIRALTLLQQELHWKADYEGKKQALRAYEDEMIRTFASARFLVPFQSDGPPFNPGCSMKFASVSNAEGRSAMPIFSDWDQFALAYSLDEWKGWVVGADELPGLPAETVVLNVSTLAFAMNKSFREQLLSLSKSASAPEEKGKAPLSQEEYQGYVIPLKGSTLRERIEEMIRIMSETMGRPADLGKLRKLYASQNVPLHPAGERFLSRYAYLFSTMSPAFEKEEDNPEFYFDTFDEVREGQDNSLRTAFGRDWRATAVSGCPVTPVGIYGFGNPLTVYAGEDGKLYAFNGFTDKVRVYETLVDLLEEALEGHLPIGLDD